jgi:hypothetical protein
VPRSSFALEAAASPTLFQEYLGNITENVNKIQNYQILSRMSDTGDYYKLSDTNAHVVSYSLIQCAVVILCACTQAHFIKRLFSAVDTKSKSYKPKA